MTPELARALTEVASVDLGARIKAARVAAGLTQPELGGDEASAAFLSRIERGERRPGAELVLVLAARLGVAPEYLLIGEDWQDVRRLELLIDLAELSLVGGEAQAALDQAGEALSSAHLGSVHGGERRARLVLAGALDALGRPGATEAYQAIVEHDPDQATRLRAATALCRIWRESGQLDRAITVARAAMAAIPAGELATEESIRLTVTLAAALHVDGRVHEATEIVDRAIHESERLQSPLARASAYWNASMIRSEAGDMDRAIVLARRALHLLEDTERVRDVGRLRSQLGIMLLHDDPPRLDDAREQLAQAGRELAWSEASTTDLLRNDLLTAQACHVAGDDDAARAGALGVVERAGTELPLLGVDAMVLLGQIAWTAGVREEAREWYRRAILVLTGVGADHEASQLWFELGAAADEAGLVDEARDAYRRAAVASGMRPRLAPVPRAAGHAVQR